MANIIRKDKLPSIAKVFEERTNDTGRPIASGISLLRAEGVQLDVHGEGGLPNAIFRNI